MWERQYKLASVAIAVNRGKQGEWVLNCAFPLGHKTYLSIKQQNITDLFLNRKLSPKDEEREKEVFVVAFLNEDQKCL